MKERITIKDLLLLQGVVIIYTLSGIMAKFSAGEELFSPKFFMFYALDFLILGIYAIFWQQLIKKFELSVAYANRAMALLWSLLWSVIIFNEGITLKKIIGVALVIVGTMIINGGNDD